MSKRWPDIGRVEVDGKRLNWRPFAVAFVFVGFIAFLVTWKGHQ